MPSTRYLAYRESECGTNDAVADPCFQLHIVNCHRQKLCKHGTERLYSTFRFIYILSAEVRQSVCTSVQVATESIEIIALSFFEFSR